MPIWAYFFIAVGVVLVVLVLFLAFSVLRGRRTTQLKESFGPEYDRTVNQLGDQRAAEKELVERRRTHDKLDIVELSAQSQERYAKAWRNVQAGFIDSPDGALRDADRLLTEVMRERGYPVDDFERRAADISVDHPEVVEEYRHAHRVYEVQENGDVSTDDQRQAFVHYRTLFERLLTPHGDGVANNDAPAWQDETTTTSDNAKEAR